MKQDVIKIQDFSDALTKQGLFQGKKWIMRRNGKRNKIE